MFMDLIKSIFTWVFSILFIILMFPFTIIIWLTGVPAGKSALFVHRWLSVQGRVLIRVSPLWKLEIDGRENYVPGNNYVMISNHQSLLDIPVIKCLRLDYRWVSKVENFKVPILGQSMHMAGYILLERGNKESVIRMMEKSADALRKGESVFIFPEGTRSPDSEIHRFKNGAFRLALDNNVPILPVLIDGTGEVLPRKGFIFSAGYLLKMRMLKPIHPSGFVSGDPDKMAMHVQKTMENALKELRGSNMDEKQS